MDKESRNLGLINLLQNTLHGINDSKDVVDKLSLQIKKSQNEIINIINLLDNDVHDEEKKEEKKMEKVYYCRSKVEEAKSIQEGWIKKYKQLLKEIQKNCKHTNTRRTIGSGGCYGYEDRETICIDCEKTLH